MNDISSQKDKLVHIREEMEDIIPIDILEKDKWSNSDYKDYMFHVGLSNVESDIEKKELSYDDEFYNDILNRKKRKYRNTSKKRVRRIK
jgi:hypothetical protein